MKTNKGLVEYAKSQLGNPYWYGTFGQVGTEKIYRNKSYQYPQYYKDSDYSSQFGKVVHDCVGLIKGYLWKEFTVSTPRYNPEQDKSAKGMYQASKEKGTMSTFPNYPGCLVYKGASASAIHHVGVYIGGGEVIEAKGHKYGVVETKLDPSWTFWSQCPYIEKDETSVQFGVKYYPAYTGASILIDGVLASIGVPSEYIGSVRKRKPIALANGIVDYTGSAKQNLLLISLAKSGSLKQI